MAERSVIGVNGTSGAPTVITLLKELRRSGIGARLVISRGGELTVDQGIGHGLEEVKRLAGTVYDSQGLDTSLTSGSFKTLGMATMSCSIKTLAEIHDGYSGSLLFKAADVAVKERRKLVLITRECPLNPIHLHSMYELSQMGVVILPPVISYHQRPGAIEEVTVRVAGKIIDQFGLECQSFRRWEG